MHLLIDFSFFPFPQPEEADSILSDETGLLRLPGEPLSVEMIMWP